MLQAFEIGKSQELYAVRPICGVYAGGLQCALPRLPHIEAARLLHHNDDILPDLALAELVDKVGLLLQPCVSPFLINRTIYYKIVSYN
jgi:hypothetical protein